MNEDIDRWEGEGGYVPLTDYCPEPRFIVAVDVDGTLFDGGYVDEDVRNLIIAFHNLGAEIVIWSGGGGDYARHAAEKAQVFKYASQYVGKGELTSAPDLTIDDQTYMLGMSNFKLAGNKPHIPWQAI